MLNLKRLKKTKKPNGYEITKVFRYEVGVFLVRFLIDGVETFGIQVINAKGIDDIAYSRDYLFIRNSYKELVSYHWAKIQQTNFENKLLSRIC